MLFCVPFNLLAENVKKIQFSQRKFFTFAHVKDINSRLTDRDYLNQASKRDGFLEA
jgi:hypothetical protein